MKQQDFLKPEARQIDLYSALRGYSDATIQEFARWFIANKFIWKEFERLALVEIGKGTTRLASKKICEDIRDDLKVEIDNRHTSKLSRVFAEAYPEYARLFEFRTVLDKAA